MQLALDALKLVFQDQPALLSIFQLSSIADDLTREGIHKSDFFTDVINIWVTGKSSIGKTQLGNAILGRNLMPMTGRQDCTSCIEKFTTEGNLSYIGLPGTGSNQLYENINRAALLLAQRSHAEQVVELDINNFSISTGERKATSVDINKWAMPDYRSEFSQDIVLYVAASDKKIQREDRLYIRDLLKSKEHKNSLLFVINVFGERYEEIEDREESIRKKEIDIKNVTTKIEEACRPEIDKGFPLRIIVVDAKRNEGIKNLVNHICELIPESKLGKVKELATEEFSEEVLKRRDRRYIETLIKISSRLSRIHVDTQSNSQNIIQIAVESIVLYGIRIYGSNPDSKSVYDFSAKTSERVIRECSKKIIKKEYEIGEKKIYTKIKKFGLEEREEEVKIEGVVEKKTKINRSLPTRILIEGGQAMKKAGAYMSHLGNDDPSGLKSEISKIEKETEKSIKKDKVYYEIEQTTQRVKRTVICSKGTEKQHLRTINVITGVSEKKCGDEYSVGGLNLIRTILGIGLGLKSHYEKNSFSMPNFDDILENSEEKLCHRGFKSDPEIDRLTSKELPNAEAELIKHLSQKLEKYL